MSHHLRRQLLPLALIVALSALPGTTTAQDAEPPDAAENEESAEEQSDAGDEAASQKDEDTGDASAAKPATSTNESDSKADSNATFRIVYTPPRCLDSSGETSFSLPDVLERHFEINNGDFYRTSYGPAGLSNGVETLVPESGANDASTLTNLSEAGELEWSVVEEDFPALVSPWETVIQVPFRGHFDWLSIVESQTTPGGKYPDTERVTGTLLRAELPGGSQVLRLDLPSREQDPIFVRQLVTTYEVDAPDDSVRIFSVGETLGRGSRLRPRILERLESSGADSSIILHPGNVVSRDASAEYRRLCGEGARGLNPMALVPRSGELSLGPVRLSEFAKSYGLRYVASNLVDRGSGESPFRRFSVLNLDGLTVAVIGVVGTDQLAKLSRSQRDAWRLTDPVEALARARSDLETQLQRKADLTIVLLSTDDGAEFSRVSSVPEVDVVIGPFDRADLVPYEETNRVPPGDFRRRRAAIRVGGNPFAVGEIVADFERNDDTARPVRFTHRVHPVLDSGEIDADLHRAFLPIEQELVAIWSRPILPDLVPIFRSEPDLAAAARDEDASKEDLPRGFSDSLWNRFVANELRRTFEADVAVIEESSRALPMVGAITSGQLQLWLDETAQVRVVELSGAELRRLAEFAVERSESGLAPYRFSGFEPTIELIEGRRLHDDRPYRVVLTDDIWDRDELDAIFGPKTPIVRFNHESGHWRAADAGAAVTVEQAVMVALGGDIVPAPELRQRLSEPALERDSEWRLNLRAFSIRAQSFSSFGGQDYGETSETPLRVPDALQLGYRLDAGLLYDGPLLAWQLDAFAQFDRLSFGGPESKFEPYDELLAETELRGNLWGFTVGDADFPLIPSLSLAYDTEATPLSDATDPAGDDLARQQLVRILPGVVAFPGDLLRRVDLGPVVQLDMADGRAEIGLEGAYRVVFPVVGALKFESTTTLRYLFPTGSEDPGALALRIDSRNAFVHPLVAGFGLAFYADLYLAQGKSDANDGIGGLFTAGAALRYNGNFRL